ncbi:serine/threonine-protein kinase TOR, partial [Tanacetum coccineum]
KTAEKDLSIQQYEFIPLSPSSGLIGWVPHCDTLHQLIREYRDARKFEDDLLKRVVIGQWQISLDGISDGALFDAALFVVVAAFSHCKRPYILVLFFTR